MVKVWIRQESVNPYIFFTLIRFYNGAFANLRLNYFLFMHFFRTKYKYCVIKQHTHIKMVVGYCLKCKAKNEIEGAKFELNKKGRPVARGKCGKCGTTMYKILSADEAAKAGLKAAKTSGKSRKSGSSNKSGGSRKSRKSKGSRKSKKSSKKGSRKSRNGSRKSRNGSRKSRK
jgi:hypothetical protein